MLLTPVMKLLLPGGPWYSPLWLHRARALCVAIAVLQIHVVLGEKGAPLAPESPLELPASLRTAVGFIDNAGLGQALKAGAFGDLPGGFVPEVLSRAAPACLPSVQTWAGSSCRARPMQDLVPGHRGSGPGLGKVNRTRKQRRAPRFKRERNLLSYLLAGAAKCENTECKLAGAATLLLHPWLRMSMRNE